MSCIQYRVERQDGILGLGNMRKWMVGVLFAWAVLVTARGGQETTPSTVRGPDGIQPAQASWANHRPRLFFTPERIKALQKRAEQDSVIRASWDKLRARADRQLEEKLISREEAEGGSGQHGNYGRPSSQISSMGSTLGLAYRMTGEARYAAKLKEALFHYTTLRRWAGDAGWNPPWHSELNTARFCFGYAAGYDAIHDFLTAEERRTIVEGMVRLGILPTLRDWLLPEQRIHALDSMGHNWWSVCVAMAGVAALAVLDEEPQAAGWVGRIADAFPEWFAYEGNVLQHKSRNFDSKGAFYESVSYADYAMSEYLLFRLAHGNVFPNLSPAKIPLLETAGDFFIHTSYPTSKKMLSVNFGDSSFTSHGARTMRLLMANGIEQLPYSWYLHKTDEGLDDPVGLVYFSGASAVTTPPPLPTAFSYPEIGWAMLRSSWEDDATLLAVKSGFTWNHAHPDAGSFILFHGGKPLIIDSGACSYSRREYTSYYRHSRAHNVVLIDGEAQNPEDCGGGDRGLAVPGQVQHLLNGAGVKYVLADATGPTAGKFSRNYRHFLWVDGVILVIDDLRAYKPGQLEWLLHYEGEAKQDGNVLRLANGESCQAIVQPLFPEKMAVVEKKGLKDHAPDTEVTYLALTPSEPMRDAKFITAIVPVRAGAEDQRPIVEPWRGVDVLGVRIRSSGRITDVYLNLRADGRNMHRNSCHVIEVWETDAYLLALTRPEKKEQGDPGSLERVFVACGSYLRRNGQTVVDSLSKVYAAFEPRQNTMEVALSGQPRMRVALRTPTKPQHVRLNGHPAAVQYDAKNRLLEVRHVTPAADDH